MKKLIPLSLIMCLLLFGVSQTQAQTAENPWGFTVRTGLSAYNGDLGNSMMQFSDDNNVSYGAGLSYFISNGFDIAFDFSVVPLSRYNAENDPVYSKRTSYFESNLINLNALLQWKFLNSFVTDRS